MPDTLPQDDPRAQLLSAVPFAGHLGITFDEAGPDRVEGTLPWSAELCTAGGVLHGGAVMSLTDTVGAVCAFLNLPDGAITSTIESKTNFLRAVRSGTARAVARPLHVGGSFIVVQTEVYDDQGRLAGQTTQTQAVLAARNT
ncbi:PaaI family thioesterase [Streptomyces alfalfae]|uniref:Aromatic compound degradation protein PaaI n=1 Tax=Streptomyces alfalfae TaxID=1642299 RepID=A0ABN4VJP0_9ACTN|nr:MULTISPECIES: PaaI family thioesterase [Streptomyces]AYA15669.1 PaaI family thioesterase [Streptomyces fradiae]APY85325.1 aromatic compound degradation protein PaaI [Streptomyces alfalfae]KUL53075.1 aromatic compound degradation protein PaaI [Streptomyces sp. NRRL S-1521]QUI34871.1 PaaI family thioesterase [Streptomyces alfalfae]RXX39145.1 PaaI family thioesterase [Streptomyces alfalfae]